MPIGSTSAAFKTAVEGLGYERAARLLVTLPVVGTLDLTDNMVAPSYAENDTSSYPDELTDAAGITNVAGSVELAGSVVISGAVVSMTRLFNPDDAASPIFGQKVTNSPLTLSLGVWPTGAAAPELVDRSFYVTTAVPVVADGLMTANFSDVPPGWDRLPAISAVLTEAPWNAGLTSEFVIDRIARIASGGAVSSWPAQRNKCVLAASMRTSVWPEVGVFSTNSWTTSPTFGPGAFGSALQAIPGGSTVGYTLAQVIPATNVTIECLALSGVGDVVKVAVAHTGLHSQTVTLQYSGTSVTVSIADDGTANDSFTVSGIPAGEHYVAAHVNWAAGGGSWSVDVRVATISGGVISGGTTTSSGTRTVTGLIGGSSTQFDFTTISLTGAGSIEGLQVTTESAPAWNDTFAPRLVADPSLNVLQAVPAIDEGTDGYDELQTVAEAEGGWIGFRNGVLTFLNRNTIAAQTPSRTVTAASSFMGLDSVTTGTAEPYDDVVIDYTEWTWQGAQVVFSPVKRWKVPAGTSQSWIRTLPNGVTVGNVDGSISYQTSDVGPPTYDPGSGTAGGAGALQSILRASKDRNGVSEVGDTTKVYGTVLAITPSKIQVTVTNDLAYDVWLVSPANYTGIPAGTPAVWINGVPVSPDDATTIHCNLLDTAVGAFSAASNPYTMPTNQYRQDRDSTHAYGMAVYNQLATPKALYSGVSIVPDPRVTVPDRITLDIPVDGGVVPLDVFVWGVSFSASFDTEPESWDMSLDVRKA